MRRHLLFSLLAFLFAISAAGQSRSPYPDQDESREAAPISAALPDYCLAAHNIGRLGLAVSNFGRIGVGNEVPFVDCLTGIRVPEAEYPIGSNSIYLFKGGFWVGGITETGDTLVSAATDLQSPVREFAPDPAPFGAFIRRSRIDVNPDNREDAVSEQDFICTYTDTFTRGVPFQSFDPIDLRGHKPMGIEITQKTYAWSYAYADDFILFDMKVRNIGKHRLRDVYFGLYMDGDVYPGGVNPNAQNMYAGKPVTGGVDDITGFQPTFPSGLSLCNFEDTVNLAWLADNDGELSGREFTLPNVLGVRFLRPAQGFQNISYNWWYYNSNPNVDFGPQHRPVRLLGNGIGTPVGDRNKYYVMSNGEIDYDQYRTLEIEPTNSYWAPPSMVHKSLYSGADVHYLMSIGPFSLSPGQSYDIPMAIVGGEGFHHNTRNYLWSLRNAYHPDQYHDQLNFKDFVQNAVWAAWVYDNPGYDTDGDGNAGKFTVCELDSVFQNGQWITNVAETTYYEGDGQPDWRSAAPPPAPFVRVTPTNFGLRVSWNGQESETARDIFSGLVDFEGYRVYVGRDDRVESFTMFASYDQENYDKFVYNPNLQPEAGYELQDRPYTLGELRCMYGDGPDPCDDSTFQPLSYSANIPFSPPGFPDSAFYFKPHDFNASEFGYSTDIRKTYPDEPFPEGEITDDQLTEDGYLKYYEYYLEINDLLPTVPYYVNVTAFDFGSPQSGLEPLETSKQIGARFAYPAASDAEASGEAREVYIYPNPYRLDDGYLSNGYEGRGARFTIADRLRRIHFVNLPHDCTIRILSLDGDLIREIRHDKDPADPNVDKDEWDLISRNIQMIETGIYYWTVEDHTTGKIQIGKFVVIK